MTQKMVILSGLPASGKSTYARQLMASEPGKWFRVNWDDIRQELFPDGYKFSKANEALVRHHSVLMARLAADKGLNLIIDNTNLNPKSVKAWEDMAHQLGLLIDHHWFLESVKECVRRDSLRTGTDQVGRVVIERMALQHGLIDWPDDKQIVIVDVDGTLADSKHRLRKKPTGGTDWEYFFRPELIMQDPPFPVVVKWVQELYGHYTVVIVSGRPENKAAQQTVGWLALQGVPYNHIFMRGSGDKRDDTVVKKEILDKLPKNKIAFAIDDRNRIVDLWRSEGIKCYQVTSRDEGDF